VEDGEIMRLASPTPAWGALTNDYGLVRTYGATTLVSETSTDE